MISQCIVNFKYFHKDCVVTLTKYFDIHTHVLFVSGDLVSEHQSMVKNNHR